MIDQQEAGFTGKPRTPFDAKRAAQSLTTIVRDSGLARRQRLHLAAAKGPFDSNGRSRNGSQQLIHRLIQRTSFGWTLAEQQRASSLGAREYLEEQLHPESIDDLGVERIVAQALPATQLTPLEAALTYGDDPVDLVVQLVVANLLRVLYSPRQLFERTVNLWTDHFNIDLIDGLGPYLKPTDDREVIRRYAMGSFRDLLGASARSAAMLSYLTNDSNSKSHPNENYARELMELHTLGVDGGYTEQDVKEVARCFTGWTFGFPGNGREFGKFTFLAKEHDQGPKTVLGHSIAAGGGRSDAERVLDILAAHDSTARFVSTKILRHFWGYDPPARMVERVAQTFTESGGNIRAALREALAWHHLAEAQPKLKRPLHYVASAVRGTFAEVSDFSLLFVFLEAQGNVPYFWHPPNGYPDSEGYWSGLPLPRLDFALLALEPAVDFLQSQLPFMEGKATPEEMVTLVDTFLLAGAMTKSTRSALLRHLGALPRGRRRALEAVGLTLAAPEFQYY